MRIGIDARPIFTNEITGIGIYVLKLVQFLQQQRLPLTLFTDTIKDPPRSLDLSTENVAHASASHRYLWEHRQLPLLIRQNPIDLYHATWNFGVPKIKSPTVLTLYDVIPLALKEQYSTTFRSRMGLKVYRFFISQSIRRAKIVVTISDTSKSDILRFFPNAKSKVIMIPLAADPAPLINKTDAAKIAQSGRYLLYFGGFERRKNIELLLRIFPRIRLQFPDLHLIVVGKKNQYFYDHLRQYERIPGVKFTDYLERPILDALINSATLVVYPSLYEGFGLPVLEAMRFGTAVITSNTSSLREVGEGAAELIDPKQPASIVSAITRLLNNQRLIGHLGRLGKRRADEYSWEKTLNSTFAIYERLLGRKLRE